MSTSLHHPAGAGQPRVEEVADRVFAYIQPDGSWMLNNTGFLTGARGVTSIDACATVDRTAAYLAAIATVTDRPVRLLVNTHHHGDHTHGNFLFPGATIVAHERCREELLAAGLPGRGDIWEPVDWGPVELDPPLLTYDERVTVWLDDTRCELRHVGRPAHTTNDSIVWIPDHAVLFAGDLLFNGGTPFVLSGSVTGTIDVLEGVLRPLGARTIVPGHGPVAGPELIDDVLGYLHFVLDAARAGMAAGLSPLETARQTPLGPYGGLHDPERLVGNLHRAFADLGAAPGAPVDALTALRDMVAFNGGRPLTCLA